MHNYILLFTVNTVTVPCRSLSHRLRRHLPVNIKQEVLLELILSSSYILQTFKLQIKA